jgi:hypothetical protein
MTRRTRLCVFVPALVLALGACAEQPGKKKDDKKDDEKEAKDGKDEKKEEKKG